MNKLNLINKNFSLLFYGSIISKFGILFIQFATGIYILELTGSALILSIYLGVSTFVFLFLQPIFGVYIDRFNKIKVLVVLDFICGITDLFLFILLLFIKSSNYIVLLIIINSIINSVCVAAYQPAYNSAIPLIV